MTNSLQVGKTRCTCYSIAYHLVWIPKYRRRILTGEVQVETKRLMTECCEKQGLTLLALETDIDHIHVFVSAPPRFSPALIANLLKGYSSRFLRERSLISKKCVERSTYGQARTMWGQQEASRLRRLHAISRSARASKTKRAHGSLSSHPLKRRGTSRSYVKTA
jgi:REP element-mobilizing transposase RayT